MGVLPDIVTPAIPLPTPFIGTYSEGGSSVINESERAWPSFGYLEIGAEHAREAGFDVLHEATLVIKLIRDEVFGTILIDFFTPPTLSMFFEFDAYTQPACVDGLVASVPMFGSSQSGAATDPVEIVGTPTSYTEEP